MIVKATHSKNLLAYNTKSQVARVDIGVLRKPKDKLWIEKEFRSKKYVICIVCNYLFAFHKIFDGSEKISHICHPFKDNVLGIFPSNIHKSLLSESDFCDKYSIPSSIDTDSYNFESYYKNLPFYDFVYFTINGDQGINCKGSYIIDILNESSRKSNIIGLVVDYGPKKKINDNFLFRKFSNLNVVHECMNQNKINYVMNKAKFVFFPNILDASPRMITESLVRNKPIVVNKNILGGWKYVNKENGVFFESLSYSDYLNGAYEKDFYIENICNAFKHVLNYRYTNILKNYYSEYGFLNSSKKLADIINSIRNNDEYKYVFYEELEPVFFNCLNHKDEYIT